MESILTIPSPQEIAIRINDPKAKLQNYQNARKVPISALFLTSHPLSVSQALLGGQNKGGRFSKMEEEITASNQKFIDTQVDQQQA